MKSDMNITKQSDSVIKRSKQVERSRKERLKFEAFIAELSAKFINLPFEKVDPEIHLVMQKLLNFFKADRFSLIELYPEKNTWKITHCVAGAGVSFIPVGEEFPVSKSPWVYEKLVKKQSVVSFSNIDNLPAEAAEDKKTILHGV